MSLHLGIRRPRKHRAVDAVSQLRAENHLLRTQVVGAGQAIAVLERQLADVRGKQAEAEQVVVCLSTDLTERTEERDQLLTEVDALKARLAPYLAADANANKITVPDSVRDTTAAEDQATAPIDVRPLWEAHGIGPVIRIANAPDTTDSRTPTWVPSPDNETTQSLRVA
ncbi:hypothetical protein [Streptomyces sp. NBC_01789]|uniref:hypothetical protein n=1 Tax=Streptomyces sp. NBC_01789 TaxID=2975941 RepID=UPI002251090F|nr:hypothetical protein [Streptomyces sp. NBC_01789]MCX4450626.1 hypothetical protein [Streptomyces sp. NBC_01789]